MKNSLNKYIIKISNKLTVYLTLLINSHLNYKQIYFDIFILNILKNSLNDTLQSKQIKNKSNWNYPITLIYI